MVITDIESVTVGLSTRIADHSIVIAKLNLSLPENVTHSRKIWAFAKADWDGLNEDIKGVDWTFLDSSNASLGADHLTRLVMSSAAQRIPQRTLRAKKQSHPWINEKIVKLVADKHAATGTPRYEAAVKACSEGMMNEYKLFASDIRKKLLEAKPGSKQWWTLSRDLLLQITKVQSIPALKTEGGEWLHGPREKADLFANTLNGKYTLPIPIVNTYTVIQQLPGKQFIKHTWSKKNVCRSLEEIDASSGTGPDFLPARYLKMCAKELSGPVLKLAERILKTGEWPAIWREHWVAPIFKRGAVFKAMNYRGVHLTAQLSKVVERLFLLMVTPFITTRGLSGLNQFAYTKKRGARDVLALLALKCVAILDKGRKVAIYCSDVAGAIDRVSSKRLLDKLEAKGIDSKVIKVIGSWLESRRASVVVAGESSTPFCIQDMVYQGTVLGPQLWNLFFEDAATAIREYMFEEVVHADDLNAYKELLGSTANEKSIEAVDKVQAELHAWGEANQVVFDPAKESKHVLSRTDP